MRKALFAAFKDSIPFMISYGSLGLVFGLVFHELGLAWFFAPLMSLLVYGGSVQFTVLPHLAAEGSLLTLALIALLIGLRNCFYGLPLLDRFQGPFWTRLYLMLGLVDGTYSVLVTRPVRESHDLVYCVSLTALNHAYWLAGTLSGVLLASGLPQIPGLEFAGTALIAALAIDYWLKVRSKACLAIVAASTTLAILLFPAHFLTVSIGLAVAGLSLLSMRRKPA